MSPAPADGAWPFPGLVWGPYPQQPLPLERLPRSRRFHRRAWRATAHAIADGLASGVAPALADPVDQRLWRAAGALAAARGVRARWQQLLAARAMLDQCLVEMATGEGKTYAVALAAAAAALAGTPVHVVTANDYLARRDAEALEGMYRWLGLRCGFVGEAMAPDARRAAYGCPVTYCTARELGFDYLRDALVQPPAASALEARLRQRDPRSPAPVLRGLCMAILDEADTLLVDEAGTPLVLTQPQEAAGTLEFLRGAWTLARELREGEHFRTSADRSRVLLTPAGRAALARWPADSDPLHGHPVHREQVLGLALAARDLLLRDRDYVVRDGRLALVDAATGRASAGRAWSRGLHQLVELKEGLATTGRYEPATQITVQRFFARYLRLGGVSGTLREARGELRRVYGLDVVPVPTHLPRRVRDEGLRMHPDAAGLWPAVARRAEAIARQGRPVLVGTSTVEESLRVGALLEQAGVPHQTLHARDDAREAEVIEAAGEAGRITVATSMAGRGSDILLGPEAIAAGGLHVILCQLNASPRIDRQFLGRAGRQGQPGSVERWLAWDHPMLRRWIPAFLLRHLRRLEGGWIARAAVGAAQRASAYTQSQQRVTLCRWADAQEHDLAFNRDDIL